MKRLRKSYPNIRMIKPILFYKECDFCNNEFIRECGFKVVDLKPCHVAGANPYRTYYVCSDCATNVSDVEALIKKRRRDFINSKPNI